MSKYFKFILIGLAFSVQIPLHGSVLQKSTTLLHILDHFQYYKLIHSRFHCGNLLEHSLWVARSLAEWFDHKKFWIEDLYDMKDLVILGGLLHDIGKAGDFNFYYKHKPNHPVEGALYIQGLRPFCTNASQGGALSIKNLLEELEISNTERDILTVIILMHLEFGNISKKIDKFGQSALSEAASNYLRKLKKYCDALDLKFTAKILKACIAVSAADVRGIQANTYLNSTLKQALGLRFSRYYQHHNHKGFNAYKEFNLENKGLKIRNRLCKLLKYTSF